MFPVEQAHRTEEQAQRPPKVTFDQALAAFESQADMARQFGVSRASVSEWKEDGELPEGRVWQLIAMKPKEFGHLRRASGVSA